MTINNQSAGAVGAVAALTVSSPVLNTRSESVTARPGDALQLSRLGGVLNVFSTNASHSFHRLNALKNAIRDQKYTVDPRLLGQKLVSEMVGQR
jgi:hypothetical protein